MKVHPPRQSRSYEALLVGHQPISRVPAQSEAIRNSPHSLD